MRVASHGTCCPLDGLISAAPLRCRTQVFNATRGHHCQHRGLHPAALVLVPLFPRARWSCVRHGSAIAGVMAASLAREFLFQDCVGESESNVSKNAKSRSDRSDGLLMSLCAGWPFLLTKHSELWVRLYRPSRARIDGDRNFPRCSSAA